MYPNAADQTAVRGGCHTVVKVVRNESDCCQTSGESRETGGKNTKKEKNEGEAVVKGKKREQGEEVGQQTEIRRSTDRRTRWQGGRAVM